MSTAPADPPDEEVDAGAEPDSHAHLEVAIIGMAGRFSGAPDLDAFWRLLAEGAEGISSFSDEELAAEGVDPELARHPAYVRARGVLPGADLFDADFFGYSPREAELIDPQQRQFLECAWEAIENAGYDPHSYPGAIGVYGGTAANSYLLNLLSRPELVDLLGGAQASIASAADFLCTRVSYKLDLEGPSVTVQTACSSALVAVHLACQALLAGDCDMALAGGVSIRFPERTGYLFQEGGILSADGRCRAFDAAASGTVGGAGVGVVVLKRLESALADGDSIAAIVKGTAINNDGAGKAGYTAPRVEGQARAIESALTLAEVHPETISYVEAHGTATRLGDPIEIAALTRAFHVATERAGFCAVGSVKTNIGHLDAAAGIAGLLKTVLALQHRTLPPSLHFASPNPEIDFARSPFYVNARLADWPAGPTPRRAGVSSFGLGGTNAHAVLEEAPPPAPTDPGRPWQLLLLSAHTESALEAITDRLAAHLEARPDLALADVAYTTQVGRHPFGVRRALVARGREDAARSLREQARERGAGLATSARRVEDPPVAFLLAGLGDHYVGMGRGLYLGEPVFRAALDRSAELLRPLLGLDLREVLYPEGLEEDDGEEASPAADLRALLRPRPGPPGEAARRLARTEVVQPTLLALEHALAELWLSWGVRPQALLGYSLGEYAAACLADILSWEDALALVARRAKLIGSLPEGGMLAVALPAREVEPHLEDLDLSLSAHNGPAVSVVGGPLATLDELARRLAAAGASCRRLDTSHAFHSRMMEPIAGELRALLRGVELRPPKVPLLSSVTGTWITAAEATDPEHWVRHLLAPVRFADGLRELWREPGRLLLEIGPGRALGQLALQSSEGVPGAESAVFSSLRPAAERRADQAFLLEAAGRLWLAGVPVDWGGLHTGERRRRVPLPTYPFERRRCFLAAAARPHAAHPTAPPAPATEPAASAPTPAAAVPAGFAAPRGPVERELAAIWSEILGVARVGAHDDFFVLGGSSLLGVAMASRVQQRFAVSLPPEVLLRAPTVASMAETIAAAHAQGATPQATSSLVELAPGNGHRRLPLYLAHPLGGHVYLYRDLAAALGEERPVYGLRARGLAPGEEIHRSVEEMAAHYVELVRARQPGGPYLLGGSSMGGMIAFEMAQQLRRAGQEVALLAMLDTPGPDQMPPRPADDAELLYSLYGTWLSLSLPELRRRGPEGWVPYFLERAHTAGILPPGYAEEDVRRHLDVVAAMWRVQFDYRPLPYLGSILFLRARERGAVGFDHPERGWIELAEGGTEVHRVPGDHTTMHHPPHVAAVVERLRTACDRAGG